MAIIHKEIDLVGAGNSVHLKVTGKLTSEDYEFFVPEIDKRISDYGKINILIELIDFHGWTVGAAWEDTKFGFHHFNDINRLAIVGDKTWEKGIAYFVKPFTAATVRYFDLSNLSDAKKWISEA